MSVVDFIAYAKLMISRFGEPFYGGVTHDDIADLIEAFGELPGMDNGGMLHTVLEDSNYEDKNIEWCREASRAVNDEPGFLVAQLLLMMLYEDRIRLRTVCPCCKAQLIADDLGISTRAPTLELSDADG